MRANKSDDEDASAERRARIAHDNTMDVELYEFARGLAGARSAQPELRTASTTAARQSTSAED